MFVAAYPTVCVCVWVIMAGRPKYWERSLSHPLLVVHSKNYIRAFVGLNPSFCGDRLYVGVTLQTAAWVQLLCLYGLLINRLHDGWCNSVSVSVVAINIYGSFSIPNNILVLRNGYQHGNWYNFARFLYQQWAVPKNVVVGGGRGGVVAAAPGSIQGTAK